MSKTAKRILVAEDEKPLAHALELKLSKAGFTVKNAYDGEEAISFLQKEDFDVLILDLMMPKKDGFAVLEELKKMGKKTHVIVLSNLAQEEDKKKVMALGAADYFIKSNTPINIITDHIKKVLGE